MCNGECRAGGWANVAITTTSEKPILFDHKQTMLNELPDRNHSITIINPIKANNNNWREHIGTQTSTGRALRDLV